MDRTKLIPSSDPAREVAGDQKPPWADTVRGLAHRVLGSVSASISLTHLVADERSHEYEARRGALTIAATDGVSAAVALHHYLRDRCGLAVGWDTPLPLPVKSLPDCPLSRGTARVSDGYYLNFCTFSYTMPYWDWPDWEREIDWMALHGITMPLALTGHEAVLHTAYSRLGLTDDEVRTFLGGPGYLPFQYMGCLDSFAGPLPTPWLDSHQTLGADVLRRERAFGMTPVLPAFTGHVPRELAPARVSSRDWQGFETFVLDPTDPLYAQIGAEITRAQIELFGTDHLYAADPFIEMIPVDADPAYPGLVATATLAGLRAADPDAVWVMQAWPFSYQRDFWTDDRVATFLDAIPDDRMVVADLWAERDPQWQRFDQFAPKPWLWCALLNFGGRTDPVADLRAVPAAIDAALSAPHPPTGLGLSMEGTRNNPAFFELVADQVWNPVTDVAAWLDAFVAQRYGRADEPLTGLRSAWHKLLATVYAATDICIFPERFHGVLTAKPSYRRIPDDLEEIRSEVEDALWYDPATLAAAWDQLIEVAERDGALVAGPLGHDLVEVGIAFMSRVADRCYLEVVAESVRLGATSPAHLGRFLDIFSDLDRVLATRREFTFRHWESKALEWATEPAGRDVLIDNARRIITAWSSTDNPRLDDYAGRHWAGLVGGYYRDRWAIWAAGLDRALAEGGDDLEAELDERLRERADVFLRDGSAPPPEDLRDLATESRRLYDTYAAALA